MALPTVTSFTALTAVGTTAFQSLDSGNNICFQVTLASVGTNVVVRLSGSLDSTNFFNLQSDVTLTANGTYGYVFPNTPVLYVRGQLVSISGAGTPTVTIKVATSNQD